MHPGSRCCAHSPYSTNMARATNSCGIRRDRAPCEPGANWVGLAGAQGLVPPLLARRHGRYPALLTFVLDVTVCPRCGGRMRFFAARTDPESIRIQLTGVSLPAEPSVIAPARPSPEHQLEFAASNLLLPPASYGFERESAWARSACS